MVFPMQSSEYYIEVEKKYGAHNYDPIPVVITKGEGPWVWDPEGRKYLDCLSAYSALNQGHRHPRIIQALKDQLDSVTLTSRAFYNDRLGSFLQRVTEVSTFESFLPMNTGAEAVETGIKLARRWGYEKKGIQKDAAEIIVCEENFHGRTTTICGFSTDPSAYRNYGPATPGFKIIPYGDTDELEKAIGPNTVAFLMEPIQGEAGVKIPPPGYLKQVREICTRNNIMLIFDEVQTGFCRTGKMFCWMHEDARPDATLVGKALGGGVFPVSGVLADREFMDVFTPGTHGSTFGGNPLAAVVALASIDVLVDEHLDERAIEMGEYFMEKLRTIENPQIMEVRGKGLLIAVEFKPGNVDAHDMALKLQKEGVLAKDTHQTIIRFAPPLVITKEDIDWGFERIKKVLEE